MLPEGLHSSSATPPTTTAGYYACVYIYVYLAVSVFICVHVFVPTIRKLKSITLFSTYNAITRSIHHFLALIANLIHVHVMGVLWMCTAARLCVTNSITLQCSLTKK